MRLRVGCHQYTPVLKANRAPSRVPTCWRSFEFDISIVICNSMHVLGDLYPLLLLMRTFNGCLSHKIQLFCSSHPAIFAAGSRSKCQMRRVRTSRISNHARLRPTQLRGPRENGLYAAGYLEMPSVVSHRDGSKSSTWSGKLMADRFEE